MNAFEIKIPNSLQAAIDLLDPDDPTVRLISGGTALMLMMKAEVFRPTRLISLRGVAKECSAMDVLPDGSFRIGAMTTLSDMEHDRALSQFAPVVRQTMRTLANVRVRNVATIGGALAHGDPHMDLPPVLVALNAHVVAKGRDSERNIFVEDLHSGYYETVLGGDELIKEVVIPPPRNRRAAYLKCTTRAAHDWPALGVAVSLGLDSGAVREPRIVVSAVNERPLRIPEAEAAVSGRPLNAETMKEAGKAAADVVETIGDERGSAAYKKQLVRVHVERALQVVANENVEVSQ